MISCLRDKRLTTWPNRRRDGMEKSATNKFRHRVARNETISAHLTVAHSPFLSIFFELHAPTTARGAAAQSWTWKACLRLTQNEETTNSAPERFCTRHTPFLMTRPFCTAHKFSVLTARARAFGCHARPLLKPAHCPITNIQTVFHRKTQLAHTARRREIFPSFLLARSWAVSPRASDSGWHLWRAAHCSLHCHHGGMEEKELR